jgi:WD40 repeat protein
MISLSQRVSFAVWGLSAILCVSTVAAEEPVSYDRQIRPIFQANCQGCHQPAKAQGGYVMTEFARLLLAGESGSAAITPGKPDESYLVSQIKPDAEGKAAMPKGKPALSAAEVDLVRRWIAEGAKNDTPATAARIYDVDHPPVYTRPPVITAMDYSPDGSLLAVSGFHEVLLFKTANDEPAGRLIGLAERIENVQFSPDGTKLAVVGGLPGRAGEIQVWDVATQKLLLSKTVGYDTIYGGDWSPDGKLIVVGCPDNTVRAFQADSGDQVLYQGAHEDWALDTVFSQDGSHVISVGRDMSVKLTELATQRFIDNITSITPGALKGGLQAVASHPKLDHVVVAGSDGTPRVYRIHRHAKRVIGDDANHIFDLFPLVGRVFDVAFSDDGRHIAAASSLDGRGEIAICSYDFNEDVPENIKTIMAKVPGTRTPEERKQQEDFRNTGVKLLARVPLEGIGGYSVAFNPAGDQLAVSGSDGKIRFLSTADGSLIREFVPVAVQDQAMMAQTLLPWPAEPTQQPDAPPTGTIESLTVLPASIALQGPFAYSQLLVTARLANGELVDVTRSVERKLSADVVEVTSTGLVRPRQAGTATLSLTLGGKSIDVPVAVGNLQTAIDVDFVRDVNPVLSKMGCNQGTCHGAAKGKNGFKLSLRGYDPIFDVRGFTDDHASRRTNLASADDSLMLLKATGAVPHTGGQLTTADSPYYHIIRRWISTGAKLRLDTPRVASIRIAPENPVIQMPGARQQFQVIATYADGTERDVTRESFLESGNADVATVNAQSLVTAARRGEAPILVRYEGAYAATTLTVMGDREGFAWQQPETWGPVDELVAKKWERMKIQPSDLSRDEEFLRRVYLDLSGMPPTAAEVRAFLADTRDTRVKRDEVIDRLVGSDPYIEKWTNKWADLLQVNPKFLGGEGAKQLRAWIRSEVANNTPYDQFARKVLTASGSNRENPAASYYKILRDPLDTMENTTHLFLAVRFNCNKCHDHPFEKWTQDQYYQTAAFFSQFGLKADPEGGGQQIGGTAVEGAKPLYEVVFDKTDGEVTHERTGAITPPKFPFECDYTTAENASRREQLAAWMTSADNPYFAKSYVNRLWGYLFGVGIMEPIDDLRAGNPPSNPELIDFLTKEFIASGFDTRHIVKLICKSRTYQLSFRSNKWNEDDKINYSHAIPRRLQAETLYDAIHLVTGSQTKFPGYAPGTRAAQLPDVASQLGAGFLQTFGRPPRESACECERQTGVALGPVMALITGPTVGDAIADPANDLASLSGQMPDNRELIREVFLRVLNRPATDHEIDLALETMGQIQADHQMLAAKLVEKEAAWVPVRADLEQKREVAVATSKKSLTEYEAEIAPRIAEQEKQRQDRIAKAQEDLKAYETVQAARLPEWEKQYEGLQKYATLTPTDMKANFKATFETQPDGSVLVGGENGLGAYTIVAETDLKELTSIRLEALTDDRLPAKGPGRAQNGNFVLTELEVFVAPKSDPTKKAKIELQNAQADFSQDGFAIAQTIDGRMQPNNGWAASPQVSKTHWAVFEVKTDLKFEEPQIVTFVMHQRYTDKTHTIGKFRFSATDAPKPAKLGIPAPYNEIVATPAAERTDEQKAALLAFFTEHDEEMMKKKAALAEAQKPLPPDPRLVQLQKELAEAEKPVQDDPNLVRLREDVKASEAQVNNQRLTAVQDLTWALINSPAFLFNY